MGGILVIFAAREFSLRQEGQSIPSFLTVPLGLFSGTLSGAFNLGGIPSAAYAYGNSWSRGQLMAFLQVTITLSCLLRIVFYSRFGYFNEISPGYAALLVAPLYLAIWLGHVVLRRVQVSSMRKWIFAFIGMAGLYYLLIGR
jgi:uncharacterized membrane protein YfcA